MKNEAEENAESDAKLKEEIDLLNQADSMIFQSEKSLKDLQDKITEEQVNDIKTLINKLRSSHNSKNITEIKTDMDNLNTKLQTISQDLYKNVNENDQGTEPDMNVSDVEFEEVK